MALAIQDKKQIVAEVNETASNALSLVIADARGVNVTDMTGLRKLARENNVELRVIRNTLAKRAFDETEFDCVNEALVGPSIFGFSMEDPGAASRLVKDYVKSNDKLITKLFAVGGEVYDASELERLSSLPTYDQSIAMLMGVMKAPIEKFVRTLAEPHTKLVRSFAAVRDAKQAA